MQADLGVGLSIGALNRSAGRTLMPTKRTFAEWMKFVNLTIEARCGLSADDLPDCCYMDWYEDGCTVAATASRAVRYAEGSDD
jgi:hypothetical protein